MTNVVGQAIGVLPRKAVCVVVICSGGGFLPCVVVAERVVGVVGVVGVGASVGGLRGGLPLLIISTSGT